jgi:hypothetical protein
MGGMAIAALQEMQLIGADDEWLLFERFVAGEWQCWGRKGGLLGPEQLLPRFERFWRSIRVVWEYDAVILEEPEAFPLASVHIGAGVSIRSPRPELHETARWVDCRISAPAVPRGSRRMPPAEVEAWLERELQLASRRPSDWPTKTAVWERASIDGRMVRDQVLGTYERMAEGAGVELPGRGDRKSRRRR